MKDIFYFWDIATFFPSVFFFLKELWFSTVIPFTDEITKPWKLGLRLVLRTRASDCQQKCWENDPIQCLHTYVANYRPSHWLGIGWKIPYFALNGSTVFLFSFGRRFKYNT